MNEVLPRGRPVSIVDLAGELAAGTAVLTGFAALHPKVRAARRQRRQDRDDMRGLPPRIENGIVVEDARPSLAKSVHDLTEAINRIEQKLEVKHEENRLFLQAQAELTETNMREVRSMAGQAAAAAAAASQQTQAMRAELDIYARTVSSDIADLWTALAELGVDRRAT